MSLNELQGRGRLVPMQPLGIAYHVRHGFQRTQNVHSYRKGMPPPQWTSCSIHVLRSTSIPNGSYFLYTDEGDVLQIRHIDGNWHYLAPSAKPAKVRGAASRLCGFLLYIREVKVLCSMRLTAWSSVTNRDSSTSLPLEAMLVPWRIAANSGLLCDD